MEKKELKKKISELEKMLISNSKDAHWCKTALYEYKSLVGQLKHEPTLVHIPLENVAKQIQGETYSMTLCNDGTAVYHTFGGYTLIANHTLGLAQCIAEYVNNQSEILSEEERELLELDLSAFAYVMNAPLLCATDMDLKYDVATKVVQFLQSKTEEIMNADLKEETQDDIERNELFKNASIALEEIKDELKKEEQS